MLTLDQRRDLLRISRIKLGIDTRVPKEKAIDCIVEKAIFVCSPDGACSMEEINDSISSLGLMEGLVEFELRKSLLRLQSEDKVELSPEHKVFLKETNRKDLEVEISEANNLLKRVSDRVYKLVINHRNEKELTRSFLEFVSIVFARFGDQWIKSISRDSVQKDFLREADLSEIYRNIASKHGLPKVQRDSLKALSLRFFEENDPDYNQLKFNLGQSFYITKVLGLNIQEDLFSQNIWKGSLFYLDTNVIFSLLLLEARSNRTLKEFSKICNKIGISLGCSHETIEEIKRVVAYYKNNIKFFDEIPETLASKIKGTFFETYREEKRKNSKFNVEDLFKPFEDLSKILPGQFGINIIDEAKFIALSRRAEKEKAIQNIFNAKSIEIRKRKKSDPSLIHDVFHYLLVEEERKMNEKTWFLSFDASLPYVAADLQKSGEPPFCSKPDTLMQYFSLFLQGEEEIKDFSEAFSIMVAGQLFPSKKIFDIRDFEMFTDMDVEIGQMSPVDIEAALLHVKQTVLKGAVYSRSDFEKVAYELKKVFSARKDKDEIVKRQSDILEAERRVFQEEKGAYISQIEELKQTLNSQNQELARIKEGEIVKRREKRLKGQRITSSISAGLLVIVFAFFFYFLYINIKELGEGNNFFQKIVNAWGIVLALMTGLGWSLVKCRKNYLTKKEEIL